jgi:hypothetical protein
MMIDSEIEFELDTTEIADEVRQTLESDVEQIIHDFDFDDHVETAVSRLDLNDYIDIDEAVSRLNLNDYIDLDDIRYNIEDDINDYVMRNMDVEDQVQEALSNIDLSEYVDVDDIVYQVNSELHDYEMLHDEQVDILERMHNLGKLVRELEIEILRLKTPLLVRIVKTIRGWF